MVLFDSGKIKSGVIANSFWNLTMFSSPSRGEGEGVSIVIANPPQAEWQSHLFSIYP